MHRRLQQIIVVLLGCGLGVGLWVSGDTGRWILALMLLMIVPGWWWQQLWPLTQMPVMGRWMMQATIGPALIIVLYAWAAWLDIALPVGWMWSGLGLLTLAMLWQIQLDVRVLLQHQGWVGAVVGVMVLVGVTRWWHIDGLVLPPWVDGVHHALLVRVAVEQSHAAWNLVPYVPVTSLMYHTGWHSVMAFVWAIRPTAFIHLGWFLLIIGQWWNLLAVVSVAAIAWYWWRSWSAVVAVLIVVGLWSMMPAYYVSWGRYTLLAGMAWLPVAMVACELVWQDDEGYRWYWCVPVIAGLLMLHMVVAMLVILWACVIWWQRGRPLTNWWVALLSVTLCILPWLAMVIAQTQLTGSNDASARYVTGNASHNAFVASLFWSRHQWWMLPLTLGGAWWLVHRRRVQVAMIVLWWALVIGFANPVVVGLPYVSFFTNETWITAMYVPFGLILGRLAVGAHQRWTMGILVIVALLSVNGMQRVVRQETVFATNADGMALRWIDTELPHDAVILTNAHAWMWRVDRGSDGGWWALPLTGRMTTTPPVLFTYADADTAAALYAQTEQIRQMRTSDDIDMWLRAHPSITHVYATMRGVITPNMLAALPYARVVYAIGDVAIYAVQP